MPKKSIVIITTIPSKNWGGSEELWYDLALFALEQGYKVNIAVFFDERVNSRFKLLEEKGAELYSIYESANDNYISKATKKIRRIAGSMSNVPHHFFELYKWLENIEPEWILINQGGTFSFVEYPIICYVLNTFNSRFFLISQHNYEHFSYPISYLKRIRSLLIKFDCVYFVSERNMEVARRQLATSVIPTFDLIKNPCKLQLAKPITYPSQGDVMLLACVSRIDCRNKALDILLESLAEESILKYKWRLELWGAGPDEDYIKELVGYFNLERRVLIKGHSNDIKDVWSNNEILIMPSYNEGTPLTVMESMMCGRSCVISDVGDNDKLVQDGINGYLIAASTKKLIMEKLVLAFNTRNEWPSMGINAHSSVSAYIDTEPGKTLLKRINARL